MIALARGIGAAAVALAGFIPCPTTTCGRWGRTCAGCHRRRYSPFTLRTRW
ncbi:hypothetical protein ACGFIY_21055 [Micromonospora chersina]|uniref:hypothetical protein n=1 Tax=Micromonospora chersina TaxID=47854 RepID=UPI00371A0BCF